MGLRTFPVVGEALHFGARRFETVLRVAALPLVLLLIFNMAAAFGYLSIANGRVITFHDVAAAGASWAQVKQLAGTAAEKGLLASDVRTFAIYAASLLINAILISSFMAPLIRYAGLGEKPAPGIIRLPFGPDQLRFLGAGVLSFMLSALVIYAPIGIATFVIIGIVSKAVTTPYAHFPDATSLHTIDLIAGRDALAMRGGLWVYEYGYWGAAAAVIAALLAIVFMLHFRPRAEDKTAGIGFLGRMLGVIAGIAAFFALVAFAAVKIAAARKAEFPPETLAMAMFAAAALAAAIFFNLRLYPYVGVAVCRRSMAFGGTFRVTRRFNVFRLAFAFLSLGIILLLMQMLLMSLGGGGAYAVVGYLGVAVESYVRLINGGEGGAWVLPFFGWLWAMIGIAFTLLWAVFTYGVSAGLFGRLYRESERK